MTDRSPGLPGLLDDLANKAKARRDLEAALEAAGLLQDEYPEQMAARSCTCAEDAICGAHRLLERYTALFDAFQESNRQKREQRTRAMAAEGQVEQARSQRDAAYAAIDAALSVLDAAFGHADAPYTPAALEAMTLLRPVDAIRRATTEETSHESAVEVASPRKAGKAHKEATGHQMAVIDNHHASCGECDFDVERAVPGAETGDGE